MMDKVKSQAIDIEYLRVLDELDAVSEAYGTQSTRKYLSNYSPRIKAQIYSLLTLVEANGSRRLLSIGGWPGISGIVLRRISGIEITLLDHPSLLGEQFSEFYEQQGLKTVKVDLSESGQNQLPVSDVFDLIECCQCIEHWNFNPIAVFQDLFRRVLSPTGFLFLTVPNAVSLYRRLFTLLGFNPYPSMSNFIDSAHGIPGAEIASHWREYTQRDLMELICYTGGDCISLKMRHYRLLYPMSPAQRIHQMLHRIHPSLMSNIVVIARPQDTPKHRT